MIQNHFEKSFWNDANAQLLLQWCFRWWGFKYVVVFVFIKLASSVETRMANTSLHSQARYGLSEALHVQNWSHTGRLSCRERESICRFGMPHYSSFIQHGNYGIWCQTVLPKTHQRCMVSRFLPAIVRFHKSTKEAMSRLSSLCGMLVNFYFGILMESINTLLKWHQGWGFHPFPRSLNNEDTATDSNLTH